MIGTSRDPFPDPGEHREYTGEQSWKLISSEYAGGYTRLEDVIQDPQGNYWVSYSQTSAYRPLPNWYDLGEGEAITATRLLMRRVTLSDPSKPELGVPILLVTQDTNRAPFDRMNVWHGEIGVSSDGKQFAVFDSVVPANVGEVTHRTFSVGNIPSLSQTFVDDVSSRHGDLERFVRELGYWELRDPTSKYQRGTVLDNGYVIAGMHVDEKSAGGFVAAELLPVTNDGPPILVFRGTDYLPSELLLTADVDVEGVGYKQFENNRQMDPRLDSRSLHIVRQASDSHGA